MTSSNGKSFYGWWVVVGGTLIYFSGCACSFYSFGVFLPVVCADTGMSITAFSVSLSLFSLSMCLAAPLVGMSIGMFGARKNIIAGNLASALGLMALYFASQAWHFYLLFGVVSGLGQGFGMFVATTTVANNWFIRRRAMAVALVVTAGAIGGFAGPTMSAALISGIGWRLAWVALGGIVLVLAVILGGVLVRNRPEDMGQMPDGGAPAAQEESGVSRQGRVHQTSVDWRTRDALRTPAFWMIVAVMVAHGFALNTMVAHQVSYLGDVGISAMMAATAMGVVPGASIAGRLGFGYLATRFETRHLVALLLVGLVAAVVILMSFTSLAMIYIYAVLFGICYGAIIPALPNFLGAYFGRANYAQILGWVMPVTTIFGAVAPIMAGAIRDGTGSYMPAFAVVAALAGVSVVLAFLARPPQPRSGE